MKKITELINNERESYIFPFFWQHGEDEATLRDYMRAIQEANINAVCVECRPHPDFCGPKWWEDFDVILDEARKRDMKIWILDDDHFPTGHANGGISRADVSLRPWYVDSVFCDCFGPSPANRFDIAAAIKDKVTPKMFPGMPGGLPIRGEKTFFENDEEVLSVTAWEIDGNGRLVEGRDLSSFVKDGVLTWDVPNGSFRLYVTFLTHNGDGRTDYMNILDHDSVRVLIDEVYEKHFEKYADEFGKTILGFFSDEPMVGNIAGMYQSVKLGNPMRRLTNPWQKDLPAMLVERLGENWALQMPLLWNDGTDEETVKVRIAYMDAVTRLIEKNFAGQLAEWCEAHGVEYIGHLWEDKHMSYALGGGLGHYYRAIRGNHMGGVDVVFHSQYPWSNHTTKDSMSGDFYYYTIGKLASSAAHLDAHKQGRSLCELFGATGWDFGVDKMKHLADNYLVSGVNRYVPHAFSPKAFPDPDCPPHFYAHGENAQFPAFGRLMLYMQRMCHLLDGGKAHPEAAILYHAENDWVSELDSVRHDQYCDVPARLLGEAQIDYDIVPVDVLTEENLKDGRLVVGGYEYKVLVVPASDHTSSALAAFAEKAKNAGFPILFLETLPVEVGCGEVTDEASFVGKVRSMGLGEISLAPQSPDVRFLRYTHENDLYMFVNNNIGEPYRGVITLPNTDKAWIYDAYENVVRPAKQTIEGGESRIEAEIFAQNPLVLFFGAYEGAIGKTLVPENQQIELTKFQLSSCMAKEYPAFGAAVEIEPLTDVATTYPEMMDCYRYETSFEWAEGSSAVLTMDYVSDPTTVRINGVDCGMRICAPWVFDLSDKIRPGKNELEIEVLATPARKVDKFYPPEGPVYSQGPRLAVQPEGIIGKVTVWTAI